MPAGRTGFSVSICVARSEASTLLGVLGLSGLLRVCDKLCRDALLALLMPFVTATDLGRGLLMTRCESRRPAASKRRSDWL